MQHWTHLSYISRNKFASVNLYKNFNGSVRAIKRISKTRTNPCLAEKEVHMLEMMQDSERVVKLDKIMSDSRYYYLIQAPLMNGNIQFGKNNDGCTDNLKKIIKNVLLAIRDCRTMNIIHNDITPENFLYDKDYHLKLIDFGSSCLYPSLEPYKLSSFYYNSPEVISKNPHPKSDLWSVGIMLYRFITGNYPFKSKRQIYAGGIDWCSIPSLMDKMFISGLLDRNLSSRLSVHEALNHFWFDDE